MKLSQMKIHFIGVGGVGMSALAELYHQMGAKVSGSDLKINSQSRHLKKIGIPIHEGHRASQVGDVDVVVYSSAIPKINTEFEEARKRRIPLIPRAEALAEIMRYKRGIAIGGTHGKTTTTSMLAVIGIYGGLDPTVAVGGRLALIESTARLGQGEWIIAEADESDGSFARLSPELSVITNIDRDHLDHFGSFENLQNSFLEFAKKIPFYGKVFVCGDDPQTRQLFNEFPKRVEFYGVDESNDYVLKKENEGRGELKTIGDEEVMVFTYKVLHQESSLGVFHLRVPGMHNALNAMAAALSAHFAGVSWKSCFQGLAEYKGVDRRFQKIGQVQGVDVYDDYAHHPTEVRATLSAARQKYPKSKIHLIFQPHRYSRTKDCWTDFIGSFQGSDYLYLVDIYPAGEAPLEGVSSASLASLANGPAKYCESFQDAVIEVQKNLQQGDVIFTMGAGDVWQCAQRLCEMD